MRLIHTSLAMLLAIPVSCAVFAQTNAQPPVVPVQRLVVAGSGQGAANRL